MTGVLAGPLPLAGLVSAFEAAALLFLVGVAWPEDTLESEGVFAPAVFRETMRARNRETEKEKEKERSGLVTWRQTQPDSNSTQHQIVFLFLHASETYLIAHYTSPLHNAAHQTCFLGSTDV